MRRLVAVAAALRPGVAVGSCAVLLALGATLRPLAAQQPDALAVMDRAAARYAKIHALCADFTQRLQVPLLGDDHRGKGRLCQEQPNRFAMRFTEPQGDAVVVDGTSVWIYYPSQDAGQVLKFPMADAPGGYDLQRAFLTDPGAKYTLTYEAKEPVDGRPCHRIGLAPKGEASFRSAVVWIDAEEDLLRRVRVEDENGSVRTLTLTDVDTRSPVPAGWFTFTPPPGTHVISRGGPGGGPEH